MLDEDIDMEDDKVEHCRFPQVVQMISAHAIRQLYKRELGTRWATNTTNRTTLRSRDDQVVQVIGFDIKKN
jgi:hypothetical protein